MGAFLVNIHVRNHDCAEVVRAVSELAPQGCWVHRAEEGWTTIYEEQASNQDDDRIRQLGTELSRRLGASAAAFLVHDSDFLCYWLFERGELVDEFNSCPDYFGDDGPGSGGAATCQGQPEVLLRFCKPGSRLHDVSKVLEADSVFAEEQLQQLASLLGIDEQRALADYRDLDETTAEDLQAEFIGDHRQHTSQTSRGPSTIKFPAVGLSQDDDEDDDGEDAGTQPPRREGSFTDQIAQLMGLAGTGQPSDPLVAELVQAAASGRVEEVERLVAAGADVKGEAPMKLAPVGPSSLSARMFSGGGMAFPVTPLLAAITNKKLDAARRLLELGADVHSQHPLFGSPLHNAVSSGSPELVRLLLDAGADVNQRNKQGQTPIQALQTVRVMLGQLDSLRALGGQAFQHIEAELNQLTGSGGWDECERLLREHGGI